MEDALFGLGNVWEALLALRILCLLHSSHLPFTLKCQLQQHALKMASELFFTWSLLCWMETPGISVGEKAASRTYLSGKSFLLLQRKADTGIFPSIVIKHCLFSIVAILFPFSYGIIEVKEQLFSHFDFFKVFYKKIICNRLKFCLQSS